MKHFPVREIAEKWKQQFGLKQEAYGAVFLGNESEAYVAGAIAALEWAQSLTYSGQTNGMLRIRYFNKVLEAKGEHEATHGKA